MRSNLYEIRRQLTDSKNDLLNLKNVVATGIGYKTVAGKDTSELAIICSVEVKKSKKRISAGDLVPPVIRNVPTDVQSVGLLRAFRSPKGRFRPVPGGVSTGHFLYGTGTLGCLVKKNGISYILSNNHVLANCNEASVHNPILQPGRDDGGRTPRDRVAELSEFVPLHFLENFDREDQGGSLMKRMAGILKAYAVLKIIKTDLQIKPVMPQAGNRVDCALARPLKPENVSGEILGIGNIESIQTGELGMKIKKSGRSTGLTTGIIQQIDVTALVDYGQNRTALFTDQLIASPMSRNGDSGSAVLDENNNLVGLLFAGSERITLINRIENVFETLGIEPA
jgi:hypothetical protein